MSRNTLPDWSPCKTIVLAHPEDLPGRKHLLSFYHDLVNWIPEETEITFLFKKEQYQRHIDAITILGEKNRRISALVIPDLNDIWIRDFAPLLITSIGGSLSLRFNYAPSYIPESNKQYIEQGNRSSKQLAEHFLGFGGDEVYFTLDLGNLTHNGAGTAIISNQIVADNLMVNIEQELKPVLKAFCGFNDLHLVPVEPGDVTGHVDGMCRFISKKVLVIGAYPSGYPQKFMDKLARDLANSLGPEIQIIRLENGMPENRESESLPSAYGNHMNFLRINNSILLPYYDDQISKLPFENFVKQVQEIAPHIEVVPVKSKGLKELARLGGVLNCISWQVFE